MLFRWRIKIPTIKGNIWKNPWIWRENKQTHAIYHDHCFGAGNGDAQGYLLLFHLFHHGFGTESFSIADPNVVCVCSFDFFLSIFELSPICTFQNRLPFNWRTPIGFSVACLIQLRIISIPLCFVRTLLLLAAGSLIFSLSIAEDHECDLNSINESIRSEQSRALILGQINEFIKSSNIKRFG